MNLNDCTIYVFIREDLPLGQDDIQSDHAAWHSGYQFALISARTLSDHPIGIPFMVTVGCPTHEALNRVAKKLASLNIGHYVMLDTDVDKVHPTAIATWPLDVEQKKYLANYRLRKYTRGLLTSVGGLNADRGSNAAVAQLRERPVSNGEAVGENPSSSSIL